MLDSDGSPFEGFTEAEIRHLPPTQAVDSADIVVSPIRSTGMEPPMQTPSVSSSSVVGTPAHDRSSRSRSRALGLADQICQILQLELRRGRDRRSRSSSPAGSSSGELSDSVSSRWSGRSQTSVRHCSFSSSSRSRHRRSHRSDHYRCSPSRHGQSSLSLPSEE